MIASPVTIDDSDLQTFVANSKATFCVVNKYVFLAIAKLQNRDFLSVAIS